MRAVEPVEYLIGQTKRFRAKQQATCSAEFRAAKISGSFSRKSEYFNFADSVQANRKRRVSIDGYIFVIVEPGPFQFAIGEFES